MSYLYLLSSSNASRTPFQLSSGFSSMIAFICLLVLSLAWILISEIRRKKRPTGTKWLPGPVGLPVIGRIWDIPRSHAYLRFKQWSDQHGPIYQINIFGRNHVWIASDKIASELLSKRASIHSDRPSINNLEDSKTAPEYLPLLGYNGEIAMFVSEVQP
jgi:hypothetical protein